jgi:hypothetical protein
MNDFTSKCFVCSMTVDPLRTHKNKELNLPVCEECEGTDKEKEKVRELTNDLADGFVCGCI